MEEECEIVAEVEKPNKTSPLVKGKLKQSRLPFLPMSSQTSPKAVSPLTQKKRKLSGEGGSSPKTPRSENRQPERETRLKTEKSNDSNPKEAKSGEKKKRGRPPLKEKVVKEKRKRGRPKKTSPKPNGGKNKKVDSSSLLSDDEVSSSVDDESELPRAKKKNLETTRKLLGGLYREPTQEAKISTSTTTEDGEASEEEEISTSSTNGSLKSQVMEGEDKEQISLCSSDEEGEEEEELEISRKKETEGKDSSTGSSKEEDVEVREDKVKGSKDTQKETGKLPAKEDSDSKKHDEEKNVSSDVGDDESVSSRFEMKKKRVLPHGKKGKKTAEQGKNAHNAKTPEDRSEKTKENQKKTDTKAETKRGKKKRTRLGNEESMGVKKCKLANGRPGKEGGEEMKVENKDSEERKSNDSDNSVKNNRNNSAEDCKEEKESDQNVDIDVKQKEKEATEQNEIVEDLDGANGSEKRDSEDDEADSEKDEDKSEVTEDGSLNEETGESKTNEHTSESSTSTPGKESKIKDASESDRKTENSKKRKRGKPNGNELGKGKQVGRKEMDRDSLDGKEKTATPKQDGVVSIARFFSPIPKSEGTRRKSLGSEKKNQAQDNKRKEVSDNAETKHDKERKEEKNNDGEQAEENEDKEQQENREEVDHKGSQKHMEGKEIITNDASKQKEEDKQLMDKSNTEEEDEQEMDESMNMGSGDTSLSPNTSKSPTATSLNSKALTPKTASGLPEKKLTPKQKIRAEEFQRKRLEREKKKQEEQAERERKRKEELAEKEKKRKEKEEERIKLKEEKEKLKEEQKKKKQEELDAKRQIKEEEKQRKEEAKKQAEKEKNKQTEKLKNKFASFFVAKRREVEGEEDEDSGLFKQFRIKEDMRLAPLHRSQLTSDQIANLDSCLSTPRVKPSTMTYLKSLGTKEYMKGSAPRSWPRKKTKDVDNDVEIIEEDDDEEDPEEAALDMAVMQDLGDEPLPTGSQSRAKLLLFFENRRPAYWGTWSKTSVAVSGRRPFARDGVFDYEYDSDDDWEEEETGESLSDSEGEEKEEEEDQYEVDNDFFVPHGYLSDDEAKSDQEEVVEQETDEVPQVDGGRNLKLKQKQAEFDKEMKRKTKELKPRLIGCLWLADKNNNPAYHQLLKVLDPYKAVALCPLPIDTLVMGPEGEERDQEEDGGVATDDKKLKFYRMFPEEAVPSLIHLVHGNRNGKAFLTSEFRDYHRKECKKEEVQFIARKKIEKKVKELGRWCKCPDQGPMHNVMMWYVPKEVREKYGVEDLTLPNTWTYINTPKTQDDPQQAAGTEDAGTNKTPKHQTITAFTRKIVPGSAHPPSLLTTPVRDNKHDPKTPKNLSITTFTKRITPGLALPSSTTTTSTPTPSPSTTAPSPSSTPTSTSTRQSHTKADGSPGNNQALEPSPNVSRELRTGNKPGRKRSLTKLQGVTPPKTSIVSFFKKNSSKRDSSSKTKSPSNVGSSSQEEMDCVIID